VRKRDHDGGGGHLEKGALTSTMKKKTVFGLHWPGEPKAARWLPNLMPRRLVGGRLNGGWDGEPPIHGAVRPDQTRGESCHTRPRERIWRAAETMEGEQTRGETRAIFYAE
jgi:hypothetical protein